jgi:hypothetical protein
MRCGDVDAKLLCARGLLLLLLLRNVIGERLGGDASDWTAGALPGTRRQRSCMNAQAASRL